MKNFLLGILCFLSLSACYLINQNDQAPYALVEMQIEGAEPNSRLQYFATSVNLAQLYFFYNLHQR